MASILLLLLVVLFVVSAVALAVGVRGSFGSIIGFDLGLDRLGLGLGLNPVSLNELVSLLSLDCGPK